MFCSIVGRRETSWELLPGSTKMVEVSWLERRCRCKGPTGFSIDEEGGEGPSISVSLSDWELPDDPDPTMMNCPLLWVLTRLM